MNEIFLNESCSRCQTDFDHIEEVYIDTDNDTYVCLKCAEKYRLEVTKCLDYSEGETDD